MKFSLKIFLTTILMVCCTFSVGGTLLLSSWLQASLDREIRFAENQNAMLGSSLQTASSLLPTAQANDLHRTVKDILLSVLPKSGAQLPLRVSDGENQSIYKTASFASINLGQFLVEMNDLMNRHHIGMPEGVSMLGRGMMTIEGVLSDLSPKINFMEIITQHMAGKEFDIQKELKETGAAALVTLRKSLDIPAHLADILKMTVKGQTKINLEITGSEEPLSQLDSMMNKLIIAVICAGLLVGSSLICTTDMAGKLFGIPALGAVGFMIAMILGGILIYDILRKK